MNLCNEGSRECDVALAYITRVALRPGEYGWRSSLGAAVVGLPVVGIGALLVDACEVMIARSDDDEWHRAFPEDTSGDLPDGPA